MSPYSHPLIPTRHNRPFLHFLSLPLQKWKPFHFIFETLRSRYSNFLPLQRSLSPSDEKCKIFHSSSKMTQFLPERGEISKSPQNPRVLQKVCILSFIQEIFWGGVTELGRFSLSAFRCILLHNRPRCSATSQLHAICNMFLWFLLGQYDVDFFSQCNYYGFRVNIHFHQAPMDTKLPKLLFCNDFQNTRFPQYFFGFNLGVYCC